jgi:hypothetical protein
MISRIWHGWTTLESADAYESLLYEEILIGIKNRPIKGFKDIQLLLEVSMMKLNSSRS